MGRRRPIQRPLAIAAGQLNRTTVAAEFVASADFRTVAALLLSASVHLEITVTVHARPFSYFWASVFT